MSESEFEAELRAVHPAQVRSALAERIATELASGELRVANNQAITVAPDRQMQASTPAAGLVPRRAPDASRGGWSFLRGLAWALGGAAAAVIIIAARSGGVGENSRTAGKPLPVEAPATLAINEDPDESVAELIATEDEGLILDTEDAQPQRQLRLTYLERHIWTNPQTGAVIEVEVPREDIVWMPVAMQ
jgi:hypothetical protein